MGLVYPHIDIKEKEDASLLQLDATDNTVLVPIPYAKRYYLDSEGNFKFDPEEESIPAKLYTDVQTFIADWATGGGEWTVIENADGLVWKEGSTYKDKYGTPRYCFEYNVKYNKTRADDVVYDVIYSPEKSYLMATELLRMGLPVLVKPLPVEYTKTSKVDSNGQMSIAPGAVPSAGDGILFDIYERIVFAKYDSFMEKVTTEITSDGTGKNCLEGLTDKNIYPIKFITSGAYPNIGKVDGTNLTSYEVITEFAAERGDAIALLEFRENILSKEDLETEITSSDLENLSSNFEKYKFAAAFTPWCEFNIPKNATSRLVNMSETEREKRIKKYNFGSLVTMPACFAYLMAYGYSIQTNATWWAAAGVTRGQIPQLVKPLFEIGDSFMHLLQGKNANELGYNKIRINPIMNTGSYGYRIWGNRVAAAFKDMAGVYKTMYSEFLNVRMLLCDIKKQIYSAAMRTTFEPNDDITWISFKVLCSNLLDRMKSGRGLLWYKWTKEVSEDRATIKARLTIRPIEAVEYFDITVFLSDQDAEVEE